jgi:hypothetical protein
MGSMIFLLALLLLIVPPVLIIKLPTPWLALAIPLGVGGFYALANLISNSFAANDPGPAGVVVLAFFGIILLVNAITLIGRMIHSM